MYIADQEGRQASAKRVYDGIWAKCRLLTEFPLAGQAYPELGEGVGGVTFRRWLVVYQLEDRGIVVLSIVDSARDFTEYFRHRPLPPES